MDIATQRILNQQFTNTTRCGSNVGNRIRLSQTEWFIHVDFILKNNILEISVHQHRMEYRRFKIELIPQISGFHDMIVVTGLQNVICRRLTGRRIQICGSRILGHVEAQGFHMVRRQHKTGRYIKVIRPTCTNPVYMSGINDSLDWTIFRPDIFAQIIVPTKRNNLIRFNSVFGILASAGIVTGAWILACSRILTSA